MTRGNVNGAQSVLRKTNGRSHLKKSIRRRQVARRMEDWAREKKGNLFHRKHHVGGGDTEGFS